MNSIGNIEARCGWCDTPVKMWYAEDVDGYTCTNCGAVGDSDGVITKGDDFCPECKSTDIRFVEHRDSERRCSDCGWHWDIND